MQERDFYDERRENKPAQLNCPFCRQSNEYQIRWSNTREAKTASPGRRLGGPQALFTISLVHDSCG